jgi:hypothetical protein
MGAQQCWGIISAMMCLYICLVCAHTQMQLLLYHSSEQHKLLLSMLLYNNINAKSINRYLHIYRILCFFLF